MFIIMAGFVGGMQIATDSTAGERERGSLEPLLVNPAPRLVFVGGKWLAAALAAMASTALTTVLCANLPRFLPLEEMGIQVPDRPRAHHRHHRRGAADVPVLVGAAVGGRDAGTIVQGGAELHGRAGAAADDSRRARRAVSARQCAVDVRHADAGAYVLLTNVLGGQTPAMNAFLISAGISIVAAAILVRITATLFESERIIFGR